MKVPMRWLKEYTDVKMNAEEYSARMIATGTAVEGVEKTGEQFSKVVVGHVLKCEPHPDSDHLHICQVDVGGEEPIHIVCGAPNVAEGQYVCAALDGAHLPGGKIKKSKLRGVPSNGMLCSGPELEIPEGLYPHIGEEGILVFQEPHTPGQDVKEIFGLGDDIIDFEILANRPDLLSVWGIARESASVLDEPCVMPELLVEETAEGKFEDYASVTIEDTKNCPRYCARVIKNVKIGPSPKWMREYLYGAGVRPINNIVDITNFVMLETGHPMHAFDLSKVKDQTIIVRSARENEKLVTLDGKEHQLKPGMLVIADHDNATGLAGIMGGEESEIVGDTASVLFECAAFDRASIRTTARALGLRTEASGRFERGVCAATAMDALNRACMLVNMLECGDVVPGCFDNYPNPSEQKVIEASVKRIQIRTGVEIPGEQMEDILNSLNIETTLCEDTLTCVAPAYRVDIECEEDLSEEVLRMYGYDAIPSTLMKGETMAGFRSDRQRLTDKVKKHLVNMGFFESVTFSFVSPKWIANLGLDAADPRMDPVKILNPLGEDTSVMRTTLIPSMLNTLSININRSNAAMKTFEIGPSFKKNSEGELPTESLKLAVGMYGDDVDFFSLKSVLYALCQTFGVRPGTVAGGECYFHPGRKAMLTVNGETIAQFGEIHPDVMEKFGITRRVYVAELDLAALKAAETGISGVKSTPKFPAVSRDIALVCDESVGAGPLMECIEKSAGKTLEGVKLFDIYRGAQLGENKKSVAFAITFRASDRTLTENEINSAMEKILKNCEKEFGAVIR